MTPAFSSRFTLWILAPLLVFALVFLWTHSAAAAVAECRTAAGAGVG